MGAGADRCNDTVAALSAIAPVIISIPKDHDDPLRRHAETIILIAGDLAGVRHGLATLWNLRQSGKPIVPQRIVDRPAFATRAVLLDISRDRIPHVTELQRIIRDLARLKMNHLQLSIEHALAYPGHGRVWRQADALSLAEYHSLGSYAAEYGIELAANQNCFGHAERWLRWSDYADLAELPDAAQQILRGDQQPFSWNLSDPRARHLIEEFLQVQRRCLPMSQHCNIGGDETVDLGRGRSQQLVERRGYAAVYGAALRWLLEQASDRGWTPQFWADIALEHPETFKQLPDQAIALAWGYEADSDYQRWAQQLTGRRWWVCPGTAAWRSFGGRKDARRGSVAAAIESGLSAVHADRAEGFMITEWGDAGHRQQWPVAWLGMVEGAGAAWAGRAVTDQDAAAMCWHGLGASRLPLVHAQHPSLLSHPSHASSADDTEGSVGQSRSLDQQAELVRWLDALSAIDVPFRPGQVHPDRGGQLINSSMPFIDAHLPATRLDWCPDLGPWQDMLTQVIQLRQSRPPVSDAQLAAECDHAAAQLQWALERAVARRSWHDHSTRQQWIAHGEALIRDHQQLWLNRSRPGGLEDSCRWYRAILQEWAV